MIVGWFGVLCEVCGRICGALCGECAVLCGCGCFEGA